MPSENLNLNVDYTANSLLLSKNILEYGYKHFN